MGFRKLCLGAAAFTLAATPVMAAPANPAAKLSVAPAAARASAQKGTSKFTSYGFGIFALVGIALVAVIAASNSDDSSSP